MCWDILEACIARSHLQENLVESYEPGKYKIKKGNGWTFAERFDSLVNSMATSKSMCKHMFDVPYMYKTVDDPKTNLERIESNRKLNGQKAKVMKRGKEAVAEDDKQGKTKKQKTMATTATAATATTNTNPQTPLRQRTAPRATQSSVYIPPTRQALQTQQAMSAPAQQFQLMSQNMQAYPQSSAYQQMGQNFLQNSPTRGGNNMAQGFSSQMIAGGDQFARNDMVNQTVTQDATYNARFEPPSTFIPPYPTQHPPAHLQAFAHSSNHPTQQAVPASTSSYPPLLTSYQDPGNADQMVATWRINLEPETRPSSSDYNSGESNSSEQYDATQGQPQFNNPNYVHATQSSSEESENTQMPDQEFAYPPQTNLTELIQQSQARAQQPHGSQTNSTRGYPQNDGKAW